MVYCHGRLVAVVLDHQNGKPVPRCACGRWLPWYVWR